LFTSVFNAKRLNLYSQGMLQFFSQVSCLSLSFKRFITPSNRLEMHNLIDLIALGTAERREKKKSKHHRRSKSKKDKKRKRSSKDIKKIDSDDFFRKNTEYRGWLDTAKGILFSELTAEQARLIFTNEFVRTWNKGELPEHYYRGEAVPSKPQVGWSVGGDVASADLPSSTFWRGALLLVYCTHTRD
jgi:hypothetical protein